MEAAEVLPDKLEGGLFRYVEKNQGKNRGKASPPWEWRQELCSASLDYLWSFPHSDCSGYSGPAMAVIITVTNGINAFSDKGVSSHEIIIENEERQEMKSEHSGAETLEKDIRERLDAARALYEEGTITGEEYEAKRKEILERL